MVLFSVAAVLMLASASADTCSLIAGNYYCSEVSQVQFEGMSSNSGSYNRITDMSSLGICSSEEYSYSGSLSPLDEELSVHFRGPIKLAQFAAYTKSGSSSSKRSAEEAPLKRHAHKKRAPVYITETELGTMYVTVDGDGNLVTPTATTSEEGSSSSTSTTTAAAAGTTSSKSVPVYIASEVNNYNYNHLDQTSVTGPATITTSIAQPSSTVAAVASGSGWSRNAYYDASAGSADGLVFLNNLGGSGSGVFDYVYGNSLSYCASDGVSCASSPQVLSDTLVASDKEFIIFSDSKCSGSDCGYYREGIPAYHGFSGDEKIFLFEFEMPTDSSSSSANADMPAIWLLNAQIPRTLQYGKESCSCWSSGCGELDLFEILNTGNDRLTTTFHSGIGNGGGSSDYFARPTSGTMKAAVIFDNGVITITTLDDSVDFSSALDSSTIESWISATSGSRNVVTVA